MGTEFATSLLRLLLPIGLLLSALSHWFPRPVGPILSGLAVLLTAVALVAILLRNRRNRRRR